MKTCVEYLRRWTKGAKTSLKFEITIVWREPLDHASDCYFCAINNTGINRKNWHSLQYPDLPSARRPVAYCEEKFLYQHSQTFLTATTSPPVQTREDIQKRSIKHKMVRSPFHNVSIMIRFEISASRSLPPSCWSPDSKRKSYQARTRILHSFVEGMRTTWATSARRKTSFTAEMSPVFLVNSALLNTIREIGDSSLTAASVLWSVCTSPTGSSSPQSLLRTPQLSKRNVKYVLDKIQYEQHQWIICVSRWWTF